MKIKLRKIFGIILCVLAIIMFQSCVKNTNDKTYKILTILGFQIPLKNIFVEMSDKELACYYAASLNMKSVLLALALVKGRIDANEAGRLSYLEELWQNEMWGTDDDAEKIRLERCAELKKIESYLKR